ncbi:hypothetical protein [Pinibacter soli]|uniref:Uncharacterized protein n=1 Tax=Pinibacter soli TaxID=3044211 RepID=A0ABT6RFD7_9BACT|nr:hypothetical protein [Pinibacter soli]MDI3321292.1 hypothetical protein [Pinibacter soli]
MKKIIPSFVVCVISLLALTNSYGQTLKMQTPQLKDYDLKNYLPKLGPVQNKDNSAAGKIKITEISVTKLLPYQSQQAKLIGRNTHSDIYQMPIDKMPCTVPNNSVCYKMNSVKTDNGQVENMPNATGKQNWLFGESKKEHSR